MEGSTPQHKGGLGAGSISNKFTLRIVDELLNMADTGKKSLEKGHLDSLMCQPLRGANRAVAVAALLFLSTLSSIEIYETRRGDDRRRRYGCSSWMWGHRSEIHRVSDAGSPFCNIWSRAPLGDTSSPFIDFDAVLTGAFWSRSNPLEG